MNIRDIIKKILGKAKDVGLGILRKGTIKDNAAGREAIKRMMQPMPEGMPFEVKEKMNRKEIENLEVY